MACSTVPDRPGELFLSPPLDTLIISTYTALTPALENGNHTSCSSYLCCCNLQLGLSEGMGESPDKCREEKYCCNILWLAVRLNTRKVWCNSKTWWRRYCMISLIADVAVLKVSEFKRLLCHTLIQGENTSGEVKKAATLSIYQLKTLSLFSR